MICGRRGDLRWSNPVTVENPELEKAMLEENESVFTYPQQDEWDKDNMCSYCGSMNPDALLALMEQHKVKIEPTDKTYKIYVHDLGSFADIGKFYFHHLNTEERQQKFKELIKQTPLYCKFYNPIWLPTLPSHKERS